MPEHFHYDDDAIFNPETSHEKSDVNVRALLTFFAVFAVFSVLTHFLVLGMFHFFAGVERRNVRPPLTQMERPADANVPRTPRLQPFLTRNENGQVVPPNRNTPVTDMADMRAAEDRVLNNYGWVDQPKGVARIPIEEAKKLAVQRGVK